MNALVELEEESRCPQLYSRPNVDESGDIYFSGSVWTPAETLINDYPKNCALRIRANADYFDPDWQLTYAEQTTDGREAGILAYLGEGQALLDVFHHEAATIDDTTSSSDLAAQPYWRLWRFDLQTGEGEPIEGLGYKAAGYQDVKVDDRHLILLPHTDLFETTAYELEGGTAQVVFTIQGYAYHLARLK